MPKSRQKRRLPRSYGRSKRPGPTVTLLPSPSPVAGSVAQGSPTTTTALTVPPPVNKGGRPRKTEPVAMPSWYLPPDSKVRVVALNIIAMRAGGKSDDEIAAELKISPKSIAPYVYRAARNGWITSDNPLDRVKYDLMHQVVDRLKEGLGDGRRHNTSNMRVRTAVAVEMAKATIFKEFEPQAGAAVNSTVVAVQVIMPEGVRQTMRDDTLGGVPNYVGPVVEGEAIGRE